MDISEYLLHRPPTDPLLYQLTQKLTPERLAATGNERESSDPDTEDEQPDKVATTDQLQGAADNEAEAVQRMLDILQVHEAYQRGGEETTNAVSHQSGKEDTTVSTSQHPNTTTPKEERKQHNNNTEREHPEPDYETMLQQALLEGQQHQEHEQQESDGGQAAISGDADDSSIMPGIAFDEKEFDIDSYTPTAARGSNADLDSTLASFLGKRTNGTAKPSNAELSEDDFVKLEPDRIRRILQKKAILTNQQIKWAKEEAEFRKKLNKIHDEIQRVNNDLNDNSLTIQERGELINERQKIVRRLKLEEAELHEAQADWARRSIVLSKEERLLLSGLKHKKALDKRNEQRQHKVKSFNTFVGTVAMENAEKQLMHKIKCKAVKINSELNKRINKAKILTHSIQQQKQHQQQQASQSPSASHNTDNTTADVLYMSSTDNDNVDTSSPEEESKRSKLGTSRTRHKRSHIGITHDKQLVAQRIQALNKKIDKLDKELKNDLLTELEQTVLKNQKTEIQKQVGQQETLLKDLEDLSDKNNRETSNYYNRKMQKSMDESTTKPNAMTALFDILTTNEGIPPIIDDQDQTEIQFSTDEKRLLRGATAYDREKEAQKKRTANTDTFVERKRRAIQFSLKAIRKERNAQILRTSQPNLGNSGISLGSLNNSNIRNLNNSTSNARSMKGMHSQQAAAAGGGGYFTLPNNNNSNKPTTPSKPGDVILQHIKRPHSAPPTRNLNSKTPMSSGHQGRHNNSISQKFKAAQKYSNHNQLINSSVHIAVKRKNLVQSHAIPEDKVYINSLLYDSGDHTRRHMAPPLTMSTINNATLSPATPPVAAAGVHGIIPPPPSPPAAASLAATHNLSQHHQTDSLLGDPPPPGEDSYGTSLWTEQLLLKCNQLSTSTSLSGSQPLEHSLPLKMLLITEKITSSGGGAQCIPYVQQLLEYLSLVTTAHQEEPFNESVVSGSVPIPSFTSRRTRLFLHSLTYNNIGCLYHKHKNDVHTAVQYFSKAIKIDKKADLLNYQNRLKRMNKANKGKQLSPEQIKQQEHAKKIGSSYVSPSTLLNLSAVLTSMQNYEEAITHAKQALEILHFLKKNNVYSTTNDENDDDEFEDDEGSASSSAAAERRQETSKGEEGGTNPSSTGKTHNSSNSEESSHHEMGLLQLTPTGTRINILTVVAWHNVAMAQLSLHPKGDNRATRSLSMALTLSKETLGDSHPTTIGIISSGRAAGLLT